MKKLLFFLLAVIVALCFWVVFAVAIEGMVKEWQLEALKQNQKETRGHEKNLIFTRGEHGPD